jgi:hypothetical protein
MTKQIVTRCPSNPWIMGSNQARGISALQYWSYSVASGIAVG